MGYVILLRHSLSLPFNFFGMVSNELMNYWGLKQVLRGQPHPQSLKCKKTFSWIFGSYDNSLTRQ